MTRIICKACGAESYNESSTGLVCLTCYELLIAEVNEAKKVLLTIMHSINCPCFYCEEEEMDNE